MKFIIATKNKHKTEEFKRILLPLGIEALSETDCGFELPEVEETGNTFEENAKLKAQSASKACGLPAIADDSGLCVNALNSAPGIYSARYSGEGATSESNNIKLLSEMENISDRTACFVCCICAVFPNGDEITAKGVCNGEILSAPQGNNGFGYDPIFAVNGKSVALLTDAEKDKISHRGNALREFENKLKEYLNADK